jgi:mannose-6-phosphate isomerase-like protein (cupin superfamily)
MGGTYELGTTFVHLGNDRRTVPLEVTPTFWQDLVGGSLGKLGNGRLVSSFAFDAPWDSWEKHPSGDEIVCLLQGSVEMTLEHEGGRREVLSMSKAGEFVIVPRGTWHTARTRVPTRMLFITDGEGTTHRPAGGDGAS